MVRFYFISLLNCTFSPHYFPIFSSSRLQVLFKRVLILITTPSSYTRFGLVDLDEGAGSRTSVDREWHTSSIYIPLILGTSFSGLSMLNNKLVIVWNEVSMA